MKLILLRGKVPGDRDPKEILWDTFDECDDLYTQMAYMLTDEVTEVLYWGGNRSFNPIPPFTEKYVKRLDKYKPKFKPDVIIARGGFSEYVPFLKRYPDAIKIYHGAGVRAIPKDGIRYDAVFCDTMEQFSDLTKKGHNPVLWSKPACKLFENFNSTGINKKHDICYIANGTQAKIKGIKWVYRTIPSKLFMLHLGNKSKYKRPQRTKRARVVRSKMPKMISKCKIGILPYANYDSAPRALPEMLACGLPVVALNTVNFNRLSNPDVIVTDKENFWSTVEKLLKEKNRPNPRVNYLHRSSLNFNVALIRKVINEIRRRNRSAAES